MQAFRWAVDQALTQEVDAEPLAGRPKAACDMSIVKLTGKQR